MLITELTIDTFTSSNAKAYFDLFGLLISVLFIALLANKSSILALDHPRLDKWNKTLDTITIPISLVFVVVLVVSIGRILRVYVDF